MLSEYSKEVHLELEDSEGARWYGVLHTEVEEVQQQLDNLFESFGVDESAVDRKVWRRDWDAESSAYMYTCVAQDANGKVVRVQGTQGRGDEPRRVVRGKLPRPGDERTAPVLGSGTRAPFAGQPSSHDVSLDPRKAQQAAAEGWRFVLPNAGRRDRVGPDVAGHPETKEELEAVLSAYFGGDARAEGKAGGVSDRLATQEEASLDDAAATRRRQPPLVSLADYQANQKISASIARRKGGAHLG